MRHHRRPVEPRQVVAFFDDVVAEQSRHGQEHRVDQVERLRELEILLADLIEALLAPIDEIHLVDRNRDIADTEQVGDVAVAFGLGDDPVTSVDQDDCELAGRRARDHVAGVLLVAWRVGDDELALRCREVAISDVDGDALLALGLEPVGEKRKIDLIASAALGGGVGFETGELIFIDHVRVVQKASDQGRFAVVDGSAGEEPEQILALVLGEIGLNVGGDEFGLMTHDAPPSASSCATRGRIRNSPPASSPPSNRIGRNRSLDPPVRSASQAAFPE